MVTKNYMHSILMSLLAVVGTSAAAKPPLVCKDAMSTFGFEIESGAAYNSMNARINNGTANDRMAQEQRLFYLGLVQQAAALVPSCDQDAAAKQKTAMQISEVSSACGCQARNHTFDLAKVNAALGKLRTYSSEGIRPSSAEYEVCLREENNNDIEQKIRAIPKDDTIKLLRGAIAGLDTLINIWSRCIPDQRAIDKIGGFTKQREAVLDTCMKLVAVNTCTKPPF